MSNGGDWKETFKFFIKELTEIYIPMIKQMQGTLVPPLLGRPEEFPGEVPEKIPAPSPLVPPPPEISEFEYMEPLYKWYNISREAPYFLPPMKPGEGPPQYPQGTPVPPRESAYGTVTPTPEPRYPFVLPMDVPLWIDYGGYHVALATPKEEGNRWQKALEKFKKRQVGA